MIPKTYLFLILGLGLMGGMVHADGGNVHPNVYLGFSERLRMVTWDNAITLDETADGGRSFTRHRTCLTGRWLPCDCSELAVKLTNEFRYYFVPEHTDVDFDEIIVDWLYAKWNDMFGYPLSATLGRQNMILGEGFVVMDGHPLDGSRSIYFNAARLDWRLGQRHNLTLFYTYMPEVDDYLPIVHDREFQLIEQPEEGLGIYYAGGINAVNIDGYVIRKNIKAGDGDGPESEINTVGARLQYPLHERLSGTIEGAYQFGEYGTVDRAAHGGYVHLDYKTNWAYYLPQTLTLGGVYFSGDDADSENYENWDPLFSRWPKWSESYIYTMVKEEGVAYWTNLASAYASLKFSFSPEVSANLDYHHLMAPEYANPERSFPGGDGKNRGDLLIGKLTYHISKRLTGHFLWESFIPGSFYFSGADNYTWIRSELLFKI